MKEFIENQYKNLFLWSPFVAAFGAALYFSLDNEPLFIWPFLITILSGAIILKNKNIFIRAIALFIFGFFYAMCFTKMVATPQIRDSFGEIEISGKITNIDFSDDSTRVFLNVPLNQLNSKYDGNKYANVRISIKDTNQYFNTGDTLTGTARIFRPSPKFAPDSFDFARWAYFSDISGTGFFTDYKITNLNESNVRTYIHNKTKSKLTDALVLGYKKSIPKSERTIWQSVGLGHVWSISGFHMTLFGGWLFALFYLIFRCIPWITKRIPAKYPAIICAWVGLSVYLFISGISVATIRAFLMATLIFTATIFARGVLSLRNAALVFWIMFLLNPFLVMHAGFQLSFAAVFGLLWFFQDTEYKKRTYFNRISHGIYISIATTFIACIFTLPFIITNFGNIPIYSIIGNLIVLPVFSFVIMPFVIIGTIFAMFGNLFFINIANHVYEFALGVATHIANLPYANITMYHISNLVLSLFIIGMLCVIFIVKSDSTKFVLKNINYCIGFVFITTGLIIMIALPRPMFYATPDHKLVGFVVDNKIQFNKSKSAQHYFAFDTWREFNNEKHMDKNPKYKCTHGLCKYKTSKWNLVYMQNFTSLMNNIEKTCADKSIDYIVTTFDTDITNCNAKILNDGILIYPSGRITIFSNHRPWHMMP